MALQKQNPSVELSASLGLEEEEVVLQESRLTIELFCEQFEKNYNEYSSNTLSASSILLNGPFQLSNEIIEKAANDFLKIVKNDDNTLRYCLEYFNKCALASTTQAHTMAFLFSSKIMENHFDLKNIKIRNRMLDILQINFKNSVELKQHNVDSFYNSIILLGEYYNKVRNIENQPIFILHDALIELLTREVIWLIEQHSMDCDFIVDEKFTNLILNQLSLNGALIKKYNKRIIENIYFELRRLLIKVDNLTKDSKANILKAIDLYCNNFQHLNNAIENFYQKRLYDLSYYHMTDEVDENDNVDDENRDKKCISDENKFSNKSYNDSDEKNDTIKNGKMEEVLSHDFNNTDNNNNNINENNNELHNLKQLKSDIINCNKTMINNSLHLKSNCNENELSIVKLALIDKPLSLNERIKFIQNNSMDIPQTLNNKTTPIMENQTKFDISSKKSINSSINQINCRRKTTPQRNNNNNNNNNNKNQTPVGTSTFSSSTSNLSITGSESSKKHSNKFSSSTVGKTKSNHNNNNNNNERNKSIKFQTINKNNNNRIDINDKNINNRMKGLQLSTTSATVAPNDLEIHIT